MQCSLKFSIISLFIFQCFSVHASSTSLEDLFDSEIERTQFEMRFYELLDCVGNSTLAFKVSLESADDIKAVKAAKPVGIKSWTVDEDNNKVTSYWRYFTPGFLERPAKIVISRKNKESGEKEKD